MGLASAMFSSVEREEKGVCGHRGRQAGGNVFRALNLRCLGDIFVEMASQKFEAQKSFRCEFRVCQQNSE